MGRGCKNFDAYGRKSIHCLKQTVGKNTNVKGASGKGSEGTEEHFVGKQMKAYPCYIVAEGLSELSPTVVWKAECISDELGYLAEISKQSIGGMVQLLLDLTVKYKRKERN